MPHLGTIELQKLDGSRIDAFYAHLIKAGRLDGGGGLSPQTVRHIHRVLSLICKSAVKAGKLRVSPMDAVQTAPKVRRAEVQVLGSDDLERLLNHVEGGPLYMPVLLAVSTGLRRGELLALRWQDINFEKATLQVAQVIELVGLADVAKGAEDRAQPSINRLVHAGRAGTPSPPQDAGGGMPQVRLRPFRAGVSSLGRHDPQPEQF